MSQGRHSAPRAARVVPPATAAVVPVAVLSVAAVVALGYHAGEPAAAQNGLKSQPLSPLASAVALETVGRHRGGTTSSWSAAPSTATAGGSHRAVGGTSRPSSTAAQQGTSTPTGASSGTSAQGASGSPSGGQPESKPDSQPSSQPDSQPNSQPSPTAGPAATLTQAQATTRCLQSGISALDVAGLNTCVAGLLG